MPHSRGLAPIVGAGMAVVAAGSLVLFSVLARQAAPTPGPGAMVVPRKAPRVSDRSVINVPHPSNKIVLPQGSDNRSGPEAGEENAVAQSAPTGSAPTPPPDDTLVASVDVDVPVGGGEEAPFHFPRPKIHIGRNLDPPGDDDDGDDDGNDDEDTDDDDDADTGCTDDEGLPAEDPTAEEPAEEPEAEAEPEVEEGPVADEEPVHEEQPAPDEDVESVHDEAGELDESVADEPVEDFEGSGEED